MARQMRPSSTEEDAVDRWVRDLNRMGADLDALAASIHPTAWRDALEPMRRQWERLARLDPEARRKR